MIDTITTWATSPADKGTVALLLVGLLLGLVGTLIHVMNDEVHW